MLREKIGILSLVLCQDKIDNIIHQLHQLGLREDPVVLHPVKT